MTLASLDPMSETRSALRVIRAEFDEMPGMRLTLRQAARLWRLPERACADLLQTLIGEGYLIFDGQHGYARPGAARKQHG